MEEILSKYELERYDRQLLISGFGEEAQLKLKKARVLIAGAGGLGSPAAFYLAAAGVGKIRIVDHGAVELSNLNRQILHYEKDIGRQKAKSACEKLTALNSGVKLECLAETISEDNVLELLGDCDTILDAMDNFTTRYILNKVAIQKKIPLFHGAVRGFEGRMMTIIPGKTACLRCLYPQAPPPVKFAVMGTTPGVIGCLQATEVIKFITGIGTVLTNCLLVYDGLNLKFTGLKIKQTPHCPDCGQGSQKL